MSADPLITRSWAVPVWIEIAPAAIVDVPAVLPVIASMASRTSPTSPVVTSIESVPAVAEPLVPEPLLNEIVLPFTTMVSDALILDARLSEPAPAVPASLVAVVIAAAPPLSSLLTAEPVTVRSVEAPPGPSRLSAVAPVMAAVVACDLVEYPVVA